MTNSVNEVTLIGNLGDDPRIVNFQNGGSAANFSLATNESWKDRETGEKKTKTTWHRVTIYSSGLVRIVQQYVKKGTKLYLKGSLESRTYKDNNGQDKYIYEIVLRNFDHKIVILPSGNNNTDQHQGNGQFGQNHSPQQNRNPRNSGYDGNYNNRGEFMPPTNNGNNNSNNFVDDDIPF